MLVNTLFLSFQILNTKVIFNAQKTDGEDVTGFLTFDRVEINIGAGFDASSGIFRVPISGIYKMTFSGQTAYSEVQLTWIRVYKNRSETLHITDGNKAENAYGNNLSYVWMMTLVQGDELKLESAFYLYASSDEPLTFTGQLIHIEN